MILHMTSKTIQFHQPKEALKFLAYQMKEWLLMDFVVKFLMSKIKEINF